MLLQTVEQVAARVGALTAVIYASEEFGLLRQVISEYDSAEVVALKTSAFLSASEVVSDYVLRQVTHAPPPSLSESVTSMGWAFASNAVVLYLMNKFWLDTMIVKPEASPATRAAELAILFVLVNEVTHFALQHWWAQLLKY